MFCNRTLSESGTFDMVCSGIVLRITFAIACPRESFEVMHHYRMSFKKKGHASIFWNSREYCIYGPVFDCMLGIREPCVRYVSLQELVRLFVGVLEAYNREIDDVLRDIWDKRRNKKWSAYDRLMLGIFCFDEVILSTVEHIHLSEVPFTHAWRIVKFVSCSTKQTVRTFTQRKCLTGMIFFVSCRQSRQTLS